MYKIEVGKHRSEGMQVVSGVMGKEKLLYEAPNADRLEHEMSVFIDWFNENQSLDLVLKSEIGRAHV